MCAKVGPLQSRNKIPQKTAHKAKPKTPLKKRRSAGERGGKNANTSQSTPRRSSRISFQRQSIDRQQSNELINLKDIKKSPVPQLQFQQSVESKKKTSPTVIMIQSDDDSDLDYLGRPPSREPSESDMVNIDEISQSDESDLDVDWETISYESGDNTEESSNDEQEYGMNESDNDLVIPQLAFETLIRETLQKLRSDLQMDSRTIECLQEASEQIIVQYIQDICSIPDPPQTLAEARMKCMVMNFYTNYFRNNK